jgi:hypothetical protein
MTDKQENALIEEIDEPKGPEASSKEKKKRGRPKNENFLSWEEAREFMRDEMIPSRGKFFEWWDRNKPKAIPRFPYRVYGNEWTSWNDFLGTNNKFNEKINIKWRPVEEAILWVHTLKLTSYSEWINYCRENTLPEDIPARPELVYDNWKSWNHWLGNKPADLIEAKKEAQKVQIYYIIHEQGVPENVLTFGIETMGPTVLKERWEREKFDVVKLFWYDATRAPVVKQVVEMLSSPYLGVEKQRIVPNIYEIIWHLQMQLEAINRLPN